MKQVEWRWWPGQACRESRQVSGGRGDLFPPFPEEALRGRAGPQTSLLGPGPVPASLLPVRMPHPTVRGMGSGPLPRHLFGDGCGASEAGRAPRRMNI